MDSTERSEKVSPIREERETGRRAEESNDEEDPGRFSASSPFGEMIQLDEGEVLVPVTPRNRLPRRPQRPCEELTDWELIGLNHDSYTKIMENGKYMRFDIDPRRFKNSSDSKVITELIYDTLKLPVPSVPEKEDVIALKFLSGECVPHLYETTKVNASFIKFHSRTITTLLGSQLLAGGTPDVLETRASKTSFDLLVQLLYNPGKFSDFAPFLLRRNVLDELLSLAEFLEVDQIKNMITLMIPTILDVYQEVVEVYLETAGNMHSHSNENNPLVISKIKEIEEREPGEFAVEKLTGLVEVFDRHKYYECVVYIFSSLYRNKDDVGEDSEGFIKMMNSPSGYSVVAYSAMNSILTKLINNEGHEPGKDPYYVYPRSRASRKRNW
jgi:hypothetical protein